MIETKVCIKDLTEEELIKEHGRLVHHVVETKFAYRLKTIYTSTGLEKEDLTQLGFIGLLKAWNRFNPTYGLQFSTYAVPMISGEIARAIRDGNKIKIPRAVVDVKNRIYRGKLEEYSNEEIAELLEVPLRDVERARTWRQAYDSYHYVVCDDGGNPVELVDTLVDEESTFEESLVCKGIVDEFLSTLTERERAVYDCLFVKEMSQAATGKVIGTSQVQVCRLLVKIELKARRFGKEKQLV